MINKNGLIGDLDTRRITFHHNIRQQTPHQVLCDRILGCAVVHKNKTKFITKAVRNYGQDTLYFYHTGSFDLTFDDGTTETDGKEIQFYKNDDTDELEPFMTRLNGIDSDYNFEKNMIKVPGIIDEGFGKENLNIIDRDFAKKFPSIRDNFWGKEQPKLLDSVDGITEAATRAWLNSDQQVGHAIVPRAERNYAKEVSQQYLISGGWLPEIVPKIEIPITDVRNEVMNKYIKFMTSLQDRKVKFTEEGMVPVHTVITKVIKYEHANELKNCHPYHTYDIGKVFVEIAGRKGEICILDPRLTTNIDGVDYMTFDEVLKFQT